MYMCRMKKEEKKNRRTEEKFQSYNNKVRGCRPVGCRGPIQVCLRLWIHAWHRKQNPLKKTSFREEVDLTGCAIEFPCVMVREPPV